MDWDKLKVFYTVAQVKNFSRAVDHLNISQSAISRQVAALEDSLGTKLFHRHARGLYLTKQGEILLEAAGDVFARISMTEAMLQQDRKEAAGPLRVATTVSLSTLWLPLYLNDFLQAYPNINLSIIGHDEDLSLSARRADVAIRPEVPGATDLVQTHLMTLTGRLYASREYLQNFGIPKDPHELDEHRLITFGDDSLKPYNSNNWMLRAGAKAGSVRAPYLSFNNTHGLLWAGKKGLGIIVLDQDTPEIDANGLIPVLPDLKGPSTEIFYVFPEQLKDSKRVKVFGEFLSAKIADDKRKRTLR
jgi:DNA-binding transcriptional LysR family regulator